MLILVIYHEIISSVLKCYTAAMTLSHITKESIKTALAMTLVYGISLEMDWDRPYWGGFAVAFISLNTIGQSLNKGVLRLIGSALVSTFLWPNSSHSAFEACVFNLLTTQQKLFKTSFKIFSVDRDKATTKSLRTQEVALLKQFGVLLTAAETDSEKVRQVKQLWHDYQAATGKLAYTIQRWRDNLEALEALPLQKLLPTLDAFAQELANRSTAVEQLLRGETIQFQCTEIHPEVSSTDLLQLSHFNRAAVLVAQRQLQDMDRLSQAMLVSARGIHGTDEQPQATQPTQVQKQAFVPEPERLLASAKLMAIIWVGFIIGSFVFTVFCIWIFFDPPGHMMWFYLPPTVAMLVAATPQMKTNSMVIPSFFILSFFVLVYSAILPRLSGAVELGSILFICIFSYMLNSPRPQRAVLKQIRRYHKSAQFLTSTIASDIASEKQINQQGIWIKFKTAFYHYELKTLPFKMKSWTAAIDHKHFPKNTPDVIEDMLLSLNALSNEIQASLNQHIKNLEVIINRRAKQIEELIERVSEQEKENLSRLMGSYQGLSYTLISYASIAEQINWKHWEEEVFA